MPSSPTISIVIPVYNEEAAIGGLLDNLDGQKDAEVIVADGGSTDRTAELVAQRALLVRSATGRAAQMNAGAAAASGQTLLFLHADVRLADGALDQIRYVMEDAAIVGGNFDIRYDGDDWAARTFTRINYWRRKWQDILRRFRHLLPAVRFRKTRRVPLVAGYGRLRFCAAAVESRQAGFARMPHLGFQPPMAQRRPLPYVVELVLDPNTVFVGRASPPSGSALSPCEVTIVSQRHLRLPS